MTTTGSHESESAKFREVISADVDDWIRQFVKHFELHMVDASRDLPPNASISHSRVATARAILATYLDSGLEPESTVELLGRVAAEGQFVEERSAEVPWSDALNQRRCELIDKEIQGSLTPAEGIELTRLTKSMREHAESEMNLPMKGARDLHRRLLNLRPIGESE